MDPSPRSQLAAAGLPPARPVPSHAGQPPQTPWATGRRLPPANVPPPLVQAVQGEPKFPRPPLRRRPPRAPPLPSSGLQLLLQLERYYPPPQHATGSTEPEPGVFKTRRRLIFSPPAAACPCRPSARPPSASSGLRLSTAAPARPHRRRATRARMGTSQTRLAPTGVPRFAAAAGCPGRSRPPLLRPPKFLPPRMVELAGAVLPFL
ncbi:proline-rich receptor-like protein kinase PERK9 [Ananas comosus]|uniref:Proline-rich receptor-like protein kinase PERK9 n=1 Tax=Ananas comosus TaxID=4615 RepID=A0A6P5ELK0_ANACO|nr:proline-rich receptor-like protein kinase PERK9 [Ananas comosus]